MEDANTPTYRKRWMFYYALAVMILLVCNLIASFFFSGAFYSAWVLTMFAAPMCAACGLSIHDKEYDSFAAFLRRCYKPLLVGVVLFVIADCFHMFGPAMENGITEYRDGVYRLVSHGSVIRELTEEEFQRIRCMEARNLTKIALMLSLFSLTYFSARVREPGQGKPCVNDGSI